MDNPTPTLSLRPVRTAGVLTALAALLIGLSLLGQSFRFFTLPFEIHTPTQEFLLDLFIDKFSVNTENNIPTTFNALLLTLASLAAYGIAALKRSRRDRYRLEWMLLALVFLYLAFDEAAVIHEQFSRLFKEVPEFGGWLHYKWLVPGAAALILLSLAFFRFFLQLEPRFKLLFLAAAALYLAGAIGGELFSGRYANTFGTRTFTYAALTTAEEALEWSGIILMIFTLLEYIQDHYGEIRLAAGRARSREQ